jgi:hypothetical protein
VEKLNMFPLTAGIRQECSLSPLFISKGPTRAVNQEKEIKFMQRGKKEISYWQMT